MKKKKLLLSILVVILCVNNSIAQYDTIVEGNNNNEVFVIPNNLHSEYSIGVRNSGLFPLSLQNYTPGSVVWYSESDTVTEDLLSTHFGSGQHFVHYEMEGIIDTFQFSIYYFVDIINKTIDHPDYNQNVDTIWILSGQLAMLEIGNLFEGIIWKINDEFSNGDVTEITASIGNYIAATLDKIHVSYDTVNVVYAIDPNLPNPQGGVEEIIFFNSEKNVSYSLLKKNSDIWEYVANSEKYGNGQNLVWQNINEGKYKIKANTIKNNSIYQYTYPDTCFVYLLPNIYNLQHSDSVFCFYNDGVSLFLENSEIENTYQLKSNKQNIESELNGTGDTIWWHNINAGWYHVVISNNHASVETDSILIEEILEPTINLSSDTSICQGESIQLSAYYSNGTIYWDNNVENGINFVPDTTKTYVATVENQCVAKKDSIKVTVFPQAVLEICNDTTVCMGQEAKVYIIDTSYVSNVYWDNGIENNILFTPTETMVCTATAISKFGCDNVTKNIEVTVENHQTSSFVDICDYGNGYEWNGKIYYESGIYPDTLQSQFGCDSVNTLVLNIMPTYDTIFFDTICEGDFVFWQGEVYDANGTYKNFLNNQWGCDSTLTLELTVFRKYETVFESSICEGDTITWQGEQYFESGSYLDTLQSQWGCDSVLIFDLIVNNEYETTIESNICEGDTIIWQGEQYFESGSYLDTLQSQWGCDSILIFDLIVNELPEIHITETNLNDSVILDAGSGFDQYLWSPTGDTTQTIVVLQNGAYTVLVENIYGCQNSETIDVSTIEIQKVSKSEFKIYPNPAKNSITVEGFGNIKIIDLFGKIIISDFQNKENKVIDISVLEKGVYLITNETLSQTKLFVKE